MEKKIKYPPTQVRSRLLTGVSHLSQELLEEQRAVFTGALVRSRRAHFKTIIKKKKKPFSFFESREPGSSCARLPDVPAGLSVGLPACRLIPPADSSHQINQFHFQK